MSEGPIDKWKKNKAIAIVIVLAAIIVAIPEIIDALRKIHSEGDHLDPCKNPIVEQRPIGCIWKEEDSK